MSGNIFSLFARVAAELGEKPLLIQDGVVRLRYDALDRETGRLAARLRSLGGQPGARILVQVDKSVENLLLYLAALRAGLVYVPLNTAYTPSEVAYFVADTRPAVLICSTSNEEALKGLAVGARIATLDADGGGSLFQDIGTESLPAELVNGDDLACILYTSGTTGRSKGAMLSHNNLASNMEALKVAWRWRSDDILIHALPLYHVHGLFVAVHGALLAGATILFHLRFDAASVVRDLPKATVMMGVPTFYVRMLESDSLDHAACAAMRLFVSGSAPLLEDTFGRFRETTGHSILERYGMTETGMIASNPYEGERVAGTVGFPLPDVEVRVAEDGQELPRGKPGILEVRGENVFRGYWDMPERTREEFRADGFFVTGDIAVQDETGRISLVGRAKDLIIAGGLNIYPKEIELAIDAIDGVQESAVIGIPHHDLGEAVVALVVTSRPEITESDILAPLANLARFKQPRAVILVSELPRNAMGKVQKAELRKKHAALFNTNGASTAA